MNQILVFELKSIENKTTGTRELFSFKGMVQFDDLVTKSAISGKTEIMKLDEGFNVKVEDLSIKIELFCSRCTKKFAAEVKVPRCERIFLNDKPEKIEDIHDLFLIDKKNLKLDITEMLRQEIVLHLPLNPLCSKSCKGNYGKYTVKNSVLENKPLAALKKLLK